MVLYSLSSPESTVQQRVNLNPAQPRKFTQILAVLAMSFGCYIHGTTVAFPAVFVPSIVKANASRNANATYPPGESPLLPQALPFVITESSIALIGNFRGLVGKMVLMINNYKERRMNYWTQTRFFFTIFVTVNLAEISLYSSSM